MYSQFQKATKIRWGAALLITSMSLALLLWGVWSPKYESRLVTFSPSDMQLPGSEQPTAVTETRLLTLGYPAVIRKGDTVRILLQFTSIDGDDGILNNPFLNLYETHKINAEAHMELPGMEYSPTGEVSQAMASGQPILFYWNVRANKSGTYQGVLWMHLNLVPITSGTETRVVLATQLFRFRVKDFLGLSGATARVSGVLGLVLGVPLVAVDVLPLLEKAYRRISSLNS